MKIAVLKKIIPSKLYLTHRYKKIFGRGLDWNNPKSYNEKLQCLKFLNHDSIYNTLVDKFEVKKYVSQIIGEEHVIPTIGVWQSFGLIDFSTLPNQFVLKCTHDSGSYVICKNKADFDYEKCKLKIEAGLKHNFYWDNREWPYKDVKPRVIAEQFIGYFPQDFKFYVFHEKIDSIMVCVGREKGHPTFYFYDTNWNRLYYMHPELEPKDQIPKPANLELMISIVQKLAMGFPHVRVDLYNVDGKVYFGEFTFFNQGGFDTDISYETDLKWGSLI